MSEMRLDLKMERPSLPGGLGYQLTLTTMDLDDLIQVIRPGSKAAARMAKFLDLYKPIAHMEETVMTIG